MPERLVRAAFWATTATCSACCAAAFQRCPSSCALCSLALMACCSAACSLLRSCPHVSHTLTRQTLKVRAHTGVQIMQLPAKLA